MSELQPHLEGCPAEIVLEISKYLPDIVDLSALNRVNRSFNWLFGDHILRLAIEYRATKKNESKDSILTDLFLHAVRHDSVNIITYLTLRSDDHLDLRGVIPKPLFVKKDITFIHHALVADAPRVAAHLTKHGADMIQEGSSMYPDLTPLGLTLARPSLVTSAQEVEYALRLACSFGLPRTTKMLLLRGAEAGQVNKYGLAPLHLALAQRAPWFRSSTGYERVFSKFIGHSSWEEMTAKTMAALLEFGADPSQPTETSRAHHCGYHCWKSLDCDHRGQTPMHLAAACGNDEAIHHLLGLGADPTAPNGQGYTPLYSAISHGHLDTAKLLLSLYPGDSDCDCYKNPVVHVPKETTALHVACRFAFGDLVDTILARGPDPNAVDLHGNTAIHEVLGQTYPGMREDVVEVLRALALAGADPSTPASGVSPYKIAANHAFIEVRELFLDKLNPLIERLVELDEIYSSQGDWEVEGIKKTSWNQRLKPKSKQKSGSGWVHNEYLQEAPAVLDAETHFPTLDGSDSSAAKGKQGVLIDTSVDGPVISSGITPHGDFSGTEGSSGGAPWSEMKKKEGHWIALEPSRKQRSGQNARKTAAAVNWPRLSAEWSGHLALKATRNLGEQTAAGRRGSTTANHGGSVASGRSGPSSVGSFSGVAKGGALSASPLPLQVNRPSQIMSSGPGRVLTKPRANNPPGTGNGVENNPWLAGKPKDAIEKAQPEVQVRKGGKGKKQWNQLQL